MQKKRYVILDALQIAFSSLWLRRFRFGPVEWVWRMLTYGERLPLQVKES